jgi:hypothetical protein
MDAYEIRLELLKLARDIETDKIQADRERLQYDWNSKHEAWLVNHEGQPNPPAYPFLPSATWKSVIDTANELNKFISKKD